MKRMLSLLAVVFAVGLSTVAMDAEAAKRLGSGKSLGTQRQATPDKAPPAANAATAATPAGAAAPAAASPGRSWMGPVAGLAAGLGIAALASHLGFGEALANMVMIGLLAAAVMVAIGFFLRKRAAAQGGAGRAGGLQYAHAGVGAGVGGNSPRTEPQGAAYKVAHPPAGGSMLGSAIGSGLAAPLTAPLAAASPIPADFDTASFERNAKVHFIRLQAANDAGDLNDIRQFTTPEMFAELKMDLAERGAAPQKTDVVRIDATVLSVTEDADGYWVSVRCSGVVRDGSDEPDEAFDEIWHWARAHQGNAGWVLAGIQQTA